MGAIGEPVDAVAILIIVFPNGIVGVVQEFRAERALQALQQLSASRLHHAGHGSRVGSRVMFLRLLRDNCFCCDQNAGD